jgi:hypothetical protein
VNGRSFPPVLTVPAAPVSTCRVGCSAPGTGNATSPGALQPTRQVETGAAGTGSTGGNDLPFTGYLAIPVLLGGVALLASGLVLRRRSAGDRT